MYIPELNWRQQQDYLLQHVKYLARRLRRIVPELEPHFETTSSLPDLPSTPAVELPPIYEEQIIHMEYPTVPSQYELPFEDRELSGFPSLHQGTMRTVFEVIDTAPGPNMEPGLEGYLPEPLENPMDTLEQRIDDTQMTLFDLPDPMFGPM